MKKLLSTIFIASIFLLFAGIVHAEDTPASSVTFPFLCEIPRTTGNHFMKQESLLSTSFAVAEAKGDETYGVVNIRDNQGYLVRHSLLHWMPYGVISDVCTEWIDNMSLAEKKQLVMVIDNKRYYAGSIEYNNYHVGQAAGETLIGWGNIYFTQTWTATTADAGFNGAQNLFDSRYGTVRLFPRYNIANNGTGTVNWWIILTPQSQGDSCTRQLNCTFCDEEEQCRSNTLPIPDSLNVINVENYIPASLFDLTTFPKKGFAVCDVASYSTSPISDGCSEIRDDKIVGWSYQYIDGIALSDRATTLPIHSISIRQ